MDRKSLAAETQKIVESGYYLGPRGDRVEISELVRSARSGTRLYRPAELQQLLDGLAPADGTVPCVEVTPESTSEASYRLVRTEGFPGVLALNFASARNPGGGWLGGARAQEEDLAVSSALVSCQLKAIDYSEVNRKSSSLLYTDHLIYSPRIPFFRDDHGTLLDSPFTVSVITSPPPYAGQHLRRQPQESDRVRDTLRHRSGMILSVARDCGYRTLILGAWGCGVFQNVPADVAEVFRSWLYDPRFAGAFDRIVFAILDRSGTRRTLGAFKKAFSSSIPPGTK